MRTFDLQILPFCRCHVRYSAYSATIHHHRKRIGYINRFPFRIWATAVLGAVSLGYLFNLIQLCALVLFYWAALRFPFLQPHGEGADYVIGVLLFLVAAISVAAVIRWKGQRSIEHETPRAGTAESPLRDSSNRTGLVWKGIAISVLALLGSFSYVQGLVRRDHRAIRIDPFGPQVATILPEQIGKFKLLRTWTESDLQNRVLYRWGAYSEGNTLDEIDVGYWLGGGTHYSIQCHLIRGEKPAWQKTETLASANGDSATLDLAFYTQNGGDVLEASTLCGKGGCNEQAFLPAQADIAVIGKGTENFLFRPRSRTLPVLIREQTNDRDLAPEIARGKMLSTLRDFVAGLNTVALVHLAESMN